MAKISNREREWRTEIETRMANIRAQPEAFPLQRAASVTRFAVRDQTLKIRLSSAVRWSA